MTQRNELHQFSCSRLTDPDLDFKSFIINVLKPIE